MKKILKTLTVFGVLAVVVGCGGGQNGSSTTTSAATTVAPTNGQCPPSYYLVNGVCQLQTTATNTCPAGQFQTQYGCFAQGSCQANYAWVTSITPNQCMPVTTNYNGYPTSGACSAGTFMTQVGCLPQGGCMSGYAMKSDVQPNQCWPILNQYGQYGQMGQMGQYGSNYGYGQTGFGYPMNYYNPYSYGGMTYFYLGF